GAGRAARPVLHPARVGPPEHAAAAPAGAAVAPPAGAVPLSAGRRPAPRRCVRGQRGPAGCGRRVVPGGVGVTDGPGRPGPSGYGYPALGPAGAYVLPAPRRRDTGIDPSAAPPGTGIRTPAPKPSLRSLPRGRAQSRVYVSCSPLLVFTRWRVSPGSSRTWVAAPGVQALRGRPLVTLDGPSCSPPESEAEVSRASNTQR